MSNKPNVFFKIIRFVGEKTKKNYKLPYYKKGYYLKYITRDEACCKHDLTNEQLQELKNKYQNPKYYQKELKKIAQEKDNTGIWNQDGQLTTQHKTSLENKLNNLDSNQLFWDTVISFDQEFANKHQLFTPRKMQQLVKGTINKFFNDNNFNSKNMEWFFTFHTNTDNPHIHLGFFEKEPKMYNRKIKGYEYRRKGAIPDLNCKTAAFKIDAYLQKYVNYQEIHQESKQVRNQFKLAWNDIKQIYVDLNNLSNPLHTNLQELVKMLNYQKGKVNFQKPHYYQQSKVIQDKLNQFSQLLINDNPILKDKYFSFNQTLNKYQDVLNVKAQAYQTKVKTETDIVEKAILPWQNFAQEQLYGKDGFYSRIGNEILKTIKDLPNFKIKKPVMPRTPNNPIIKPYFKPNLIKKLLKKIDYQFYNSHQQANYLFNQLQAIKIDELLNKLS